MLVLQPTPFCNIDCKYCYLPDRTISTRMDDNIIEASLMMLINSELIRDHLSIVWHAGEPLVLPIDYYRNAFRIIKKHVPESCTVTHHFQTNGMLINDDWCDFFRETGLSVGLSMDGVKKLHNLNRVTRKGKGTFDSAMRGIECLQKNNVSFHVISVLTRQALFFPDEFYNFYCSAGINEVCFNVEEVEGANLTSSLEAPETETLYKQFMERFLLISSKSDTIKSVREFANAFGAILNADREEILNDQTLPFAIISVATNGDFTSFSPELLGTKDPRFGDFTLGNVKKDVISDVMVTDKFQSLSKEISVGVDNCRNECPYFKVCGGGAPANKIFETGSFESTETNFCRLTVKSITDIVLKSHEMDVQMKEPNVSFPQA